MRKAFEGRGLNALCAVALVVICLPSNVGCVSIGGQRSAKGQVTALLTEALSPRLIHRGEFVGASDKKQIASAEARSALAIRPPRRSRWPQKIPYVQGTLRHRRTPPPPGSPASIFQLLWRSLGRPRYS